MTTNGDHLIHARALQADILAAPGVWLPRRDILLDWLGAFIARVAAPKYELEENEASDLCALDQFLRKHEVPAAG